MSNFQIIVIGVFIVFIIAGMLVFASFGGLTGGGVQLATVTVWGTAPQLTIDEDIKKNNINAKYVEKNPATFESDFVNALAEGNGPDVVMLPQNLILKEQSKILLIPFTSYSDRQFKDTFIQEGELFEQPTGILGLPLFIDPLVMYWNRDTFSAAAIAQPPKHWDELYALADKLSVKDESSIIHKSAVSFGEYSNVVHAKDILSALILQTGNNFVGASTNGLLSTLAERNNQSVSPSAAALTFYTGFADPLKQQYSWNRSLPLSKDAFLSGDLALYFGFASELKDLKTKNPNLNFDVATIPQAGDTTSAVTFGNMQALAIVKTTKHIPDAFAALGSFTSKASIQFLSDAMDLPPVRRDILATPATESAMATFYTAALQSRAWLDPNTVATESLFRTMIESVTSGRALPGEAVNSASSQLGELLKGNEN